MQDTSSMFIYASQTNESMYVSQREKKKVWTNNSIQEIEWLEVGIKYVVDKEERVKGRVWDILIFPSALFYSV